ncbi:MAG: tripartite tricarboxylate transporter permease [Proteobacteria bacterium]|nr:tripartite tricarboxylate transporter permease [Pseudomonadota bacterium]
MSEALLTALANLATFEHLFHLALGVMLGLAVGAFPGLGGIAGLAIMMPFLYGMDTVSALATLVGLVAVIPTSDTFTSVLMGIPGSSASQATVLDGFPLSQQGRAARALAAAFTASLMGGIVGAAILTGFVQVARPLILTFGSAELFMLALLGLSMVGVLSGASLIKGLAACGLGLIVGSIGGAPATGEFRMTFGIDYLYDGLPLVIVGIGLFAFPEITELLRRNRPIAASRMPAADWFEGIRDVFRNWFLCLRCAGLGTLIGAIPGLGGTVVDWIAYGHVVQTAKDKSRFGKGDIRGVLAPESANNAKEGGGLVPTLLFGIPGSGAMAVFLGGMVLIGIEAGPAMVSSDLDLTYTIIWSLALANVLGAGSCMLLARPIARLTTIPFNLLAPFMIVVVSFAAYQATRQFMDLVALLAVGVLGVLLRRFGWSRPAFLIGFVLAPQAEGYLNLAVQFYGWGMLVRPGVLIILAITVISVWLGARGKGTRAQGAQPAADGSRKSQPARSVAPQLAFVGGAIAILLYAVWSSLRLSPLGRIFPLSVAVATLVLCVALIVVLRVRPSTSPANVDLEYRLEDAKGDHQSDAEAGAVAVGAGTWRSAGWFGVLVAAAGLLGFLPGALLFFLAFLRRKAQQSWGLTLALTACVIVALAAAANLLLVELPGGLIAEYVDQPWLTGQIR